MWKSKSFWPAIKNMSHILDDTVIPQLDDGSLLFHPQILNFEEETMSYFFLISLEDQHFKLQR